MRFTKQAWAILAVLLLIGSGHPVTAESTTVTGSVSVMDVGVFEVEFCNSAVFKVGGSGGTDPEVTSSTGAITEGTVGICITDTKSNRGDFTVTLIATDFNSITSGVDATIPVENLYLNRIIRPRYAGDIINQPGAGKIYSVGESSQIGPVTTHDGSSESWGYLKNDLATPRIIVKGDEGKGISNPDTGQPVRPGVYMNLEIPAGQPAGQYRTELTLTVAPENP